MPVVSRLPATRSRGLLPRVYFHPISVFSVDIFDRISANRGPLGSHSHYAHGYFTFPKLEGEINPRMQFRGKTVLTWSLNNYLGLANHPEVRTEANRPLRSLSVR